MPATGSAQVAVKVQFPDVERFFHMDAGLPSSAISTGDSRAFWGWAFLFKFEVATVSLAMQLMGMGSQVKEIFSTMQATCWAVVEVFQEGLCGVSGKIAGFLTSKRSMSWT